MPRNVPGPMEEPILLVISCLGAASRASIFEILKEAYEEKGIHTGAIYTTISRMELKKWVSYFINESGERIYMVDNEGEIALQLMNQIRERIRDICRIGSL